MGWRRISTKVTTGQHIKRNIQFMSGLVAFCIFREEVFCLYFPQAPGLIMTWMTDKRKSNISWSAPHKEHSVQVRLKCILHFPRSSILFVFPTGSWLIVTWMTDKHKRNIYWSAPHKEHSVHVRLKCIFHFWSSSLFVFPTGSYLNCDLNDG